jgi:hypothetical protein
MPNDPTLSWEASPSPNTTNYNFQLSYLQNGQTTPIVLPASTIVRSATGDANGYDVGFVAFVASQTPPITPPIVVGPGDTIALVNFQVFDAVNNLLGPVQTVPPVVIPLVPPPPTNPLPAPGLALTLS